MNQLYLRDTWAEINLDAIEHNVMNVKKIIQERTHIMAVVKANGYGHGAKQVAETALNSGASWLGVALLDEAIALRLEGVEAPILVLGYVNPQDVELAVKYHISLTFFQLDWLKKVQQFYKKPYPLFLHLKCDTGMGRLGVRSQQEIKGVSEFLQADHRFKLEGTFTHFATADEDNEDYYTCQYKKFKTMLSWMNNLGLHPNIIHCGNSAASLKHPHDMFNMIRLGITMYGLSPSTEMKSALPFKLEEAFSLQSRLTHVKKINKGDSVSYGATYRAKEEEWIGTIPIGYADGWLRALTNSDVLIHGRRSPIVGRICMDQCMCRLNQEVDIGTQVTLIGGQGSEYISVDEVAGRLGTINYEVTCMISERVPRIYFRNGKQIAINNPVLSRFAIQISK